MGLNNFWSKIKAKQYVDTNEELKNTNMDLHIHSTGSDGLDTPLKLLIRAYNRGIRTISITDHNVVRGYRFLQENIQELILKLEDNKDSKIDGAEKLLEILNEMYIVPGCELVTTYKGCPYVEILGYGVDIDVIEDEIKRNEEGKRKPGEVICEGARRIKEEHNLSFDMFPIENREDYRKLFFHELIKHPENEYLYKDIEGETEEEKAENFAKKYIDNPESDFYVDLDNKNTRKKSMQKMIEEHEDIVFDIEIIKNAGLTTQLFYNELMKNEQDKAMLGNIKTLKEFIYLGLYNEKSPFFVDLTSAKPSIEEVIGTIRKAGGVPIVAHWGRYIKSNPEIFDWNTEEGLKNLYEIIQMCDGAECDYPDNPPELQEIIYNYCKENGKYISQGSDHHSIDGTKEGEQYKIGVASGLELEENAFARNLRIPVKELVKQCLLERLEELSDEKKQKQTQLKELKEELLENTTKENGEQEYDE